MTDNEIVKALEYWKKFDKEIDDLIKRFPNEEEDLLEQREVLKITFEVFDLINRQNAEIERLTKCRKEEVEKLMSAIDKSILETKPEAYKEFTEKVKLLNRDNLIIGTSKSTTY